MGSFAVVTQLEAANAPSSRVCSWLESLCANACPKTELMWLAMLVDKALARNQHLMGPEPQHTDHGHAPLFAAGTCSRGRAPCLPGSEPSAFQLAVDASAAPARAKCMPTAAAASELICRQ